MSISACVPKYPLTLMCAPKGKLSMVKWIKSFPKNLLSTATVCSPAGAATPQRAIRVIYGRFAAGKAPHLHAGPCGSGVLAPKVAQMHVVSQLPRQGLVFGYPAVKSFVLWYFTGLIARFLGKLLINGCSHGVTTQKGARLWHAYSALCRCQVCHIRV
jgi:hypothetical protein